MVLDRPVPVGLVKLEVSDRHLAGQDESNGAGKEPDQNRRTADELERPSNPSLAEKRRVTAELRGYPTKPTQDLHSPGLHEQQPRDYSQ